MKRTTALLLCFAVIFYSFISLGASSGSKADGDKPSVSALSAILYAPDSGTIIYERIVTQGDRLQALQKL